MRDYWRHKTFYYSGVTIRWKPWQLWLSFGYRAQVQINVGGPWIWMHYVDDTGSWLHWFGWFRVSRYK